MIKLATLPALSGISKGEKLCSRGSACREEKRGKCMAIVISYINSDGIAYDFASASCACGWEIGNVRCSRIMDRSWRTTQLRSCPVRFIYFMGIPDEETLGVCSSHARTEAAVSGPRFALRRMVIHTVGAVARRRADEMHFVRNSEAGRK